MNKIIKKINAKEEYFSNLDSQNSPILAKPLQKTIETKENNKNKIVIIIIRGTKKEESFSIVEPSKL